MLSFALLEAPAVPLEPLVGTLRDMLGTEKGGILVVNYQLSTGAPCKAWAGTVFGRLRTGREFAALDSKQRQEDRGNGRN